MRRTKFLEDKRATVTGQLCMGSCMKLTSPWSAKGPPLRGSNVAAGDATNHQLVTPDFSQPAQANMRGKNLTRQWACPAKLNCDYTFSYMTVKSGPPKNFSETVLLQLVWGFFFPLLISKVAFVSLSWPDRREARIPKTSPRLDDKSLCSL